MIIRVVMDHTGTSLEALKERFIYCALTVILTEAL